MARASLLLYLTALAHLIIHIRLGQAMLYYTLDGKMRRSRTYEPYLDNPIPYQISGVLVNVEPSRDAPCTFGASNSTLAWADSYSLTAQYSRTILATVDNKDAALRCAGFLEAISAFGRSLAQRGFPPMGGIIYIATEDDQEHTAVFSEETVPTALVDAADYKRVEPLRNMRQPLLVTIEQGTGPNHRVFSTTQPSGLPPLHNKLLPAPLPMASIPLKRRYASMLDANRNGRSTLLASVHALRAVTLLRVVVVVGCVCSVGMLLVHTASWFSDDGPFRYWADKLTARTAVRFQIDQRRFVIESSTRTALRVLSKTSLLCFIAFAFHSASNIISARGTTALSVYEQFIMQLIRDMAGILANFAILWVLGPLVVQGGSWAQDRQPLPSILGQWLRRVRHSGNDHDELVGPARHCSTSEHRAGETAAMSKDVPIMSSYLSASSLVNEDDDADATDGYARGTTRSN
ncbi:hypothetical protein SYNPS1DRAFT_27315 [Syncephalis pseudoplumigaleata]|uniref:Uncharacterized protein n=1 Tax=Syncephalis pseudoplumigaleata TaxID=1712513 RepID=A0A4V1J219_9FUNG|nr:hypothetical protein SYNPS1DRAFT_27315 [Syncephalis pseudoplumigaleata]|eukprot:RKP27019.1 hypothetical protein SYNPS1DRAFT_27315 [Syncephalis pseudoplumigaleata]